MNKFFLYIIIIVFASLGLHAQHFSNEYPCNKIIRIDSNEWKKKFINGRKLAKTNKYKKEKTKLSILTKDSVFTFKDKYDKFGYLKSKYFAIQEDISKNWVLVEEWHDVYSEFYLINLNTSRIDTLFSVPKIYGKKVICLEPEKTDGANRIQVWNINQNNITLYKVISLKNNCEIYGLWSAFLNNGMLYVQTTEGYYRLNIEE